MTFDEFFKKKKICLDALEKADRPLFVEFETHYYAMGEKSFDHTKKYWFNKLRHSYPLPAEPKVEKVLIENQLAEQTITESLLETTENKQIPKVGFTPRYKAGAVTVKNPEESTPASQTAPIKEHTQPAGEPAKPKAGFTPRFKAGITAAKKPNGDELAPDRLPETVSSKEEGQSAQQPAKKAGFTPRFNAGVTAANEPAEDELASDRLPETGPSKEKAQPAGEPAKPKVGFTPRFKAGVTKPKSGNSPSDAG